MTEAFPPSVDQIRIRFLTPRTACTSLRIVRDPNESSRKHAAAYLLVEGIFTNLLQIVGIRIFFSNTAKGRCFPLNECFDAFFVHLGRT